MNTKERHSEFEDLAARLQTAASRTNDVFDRCRRWKTPLLSQLKRLNRKLSAHDALLFQVSTRSDSDQMVRLLGRITQHHQPEGSVTSEHFPSRLLPAEIQEALDSLSVVQVSTENGSGGRLLQQMQSGIASNKAVIVPIHRHDSKLIGLFVLLFSHDPFVDLTADQLARLTDLLRLNGSLLLSNVRRKKKRLKQQREMKQWRQIANCACDFALQTDHQLLITDVIPFGSDSSCPQVKGLRLTDIVERTFHRRLKKQLALAAKDGIVRTVEFRLGLGAEQSIWYHARIEPRIDAADSQCMLFLTDNNQDKRLQSEISVLNEQLVRASRLSLLGQMSTEFAHQINQPLQAIMGFANLALKRIRKGSDSKEQAFEAFQKIETSVAHSSNIIDSIRDFARYRLLKVQEVSLASLLDDAIMMVTERASRLNGEFVVHALPDDCVIMADRTQSTHVFINLFVNALEATSDFGVDQPLINVFVEDNDHADRIVVAVKDNGPGLPAENPDQVFEKFHTQKEDGLGLGLAISRDVCETQQGSLKATNNMDEPGCTFHVTFRTPVEGNDGSSSNEVADDADTV
ncbi:MAG: ATP-binding protein [Fuerstiella sp.]